MFHFSLDATFFTSNHQGKKRPKGSMQKKNKQILARHAWEATNIHELTLFQFSLDATFFTSKQQPCLQGTTIQT